MITAQKDIEPFQRFCSCPSTEAFECDEVTSWPQEKTVETVALYLGRGNTGLKPGVNEKYPLSDF
jgi:hypothetical protein